MYETCIGYFVRRLREGWRCISLIYPLATLCSPEGILRELDLCNDIETLRPNAAGDSAICTKYGCTSNWECVDESVSDGDTTYCQCGYNDKDLHNIDTSALGAGTTINKVTLHAVIKRYNATYNHGYIGIKSGSTESWSDLITLPESWTEETKEYATDPNTGLAWTVAAINALQIGYKSGPDMSTSIIKCTQVYIEVDYTPTAKARSHGYIFG